MFIFIGFCPYPFLMSSAFLSSCLFPVLFGCFVLLVFLPISAVVGHCIYLLCLSTFTVSSLGFFLPFFGGPFTQVLLYCIFLLTLFITGPHSQTNAQCEYKSVSLQLNTEKTKAIISYFSGKEDASMVTGLRL